MIPKFPIRFLIVLFVVLVAAVIGVGSSYADSSNTANAWASIETNLRTGPSRKASSIAVLPTGAALVIEARSVDMQWLLVHTPDGMLHGWAIRKLLRLAPGISVRKLPVSKETVSATGSTFTGSSQDQPPVPTIDATTHLGGAIIPELSPAVRSNIQAIYDKGKALGNNPHAFSKVGDCLTYRWVFMNVFGMNQYNLGKYSNLQGVINYFMTPVNSTFPNSFVVTSQAAANGFNSSAVLDKEWADPRFCAAGESPLQCEYRLTKPAYAIIMYGTSDVLSMAPIEYNFYLREVVDETIKDGIVPILSTFPENSSVRDRSRLLNQVVFQIASEKALPVMNLEAALETIPGRGLEGDGIHLNIPPGDKSGYFTADNLNYGYTMRNLVTLEALDTVVKSIRK